MMKKQCMEQNIARNTETKGHFVQSEMEMRNTLLETQGKMILVIK